jgi:hypothetical protein
MRSSCVGFNTYVHNSYIKKTSFPPSLSKQASTHAHHPTQLHAHAHANTHLKDPISPRLFVRPSSQFARPQSETPRTFSLSPSSEAEPPSLLQNPVLDPMMSSFPNSASAPCDQASHYEIFVRMQAVHMQAHMFAPRNITILSCSTRYTTHITHSRSPTQKRCIFQDFDVPRVCGVPIERQTGCRTPRTQSAEKRNFMYTFRQKPKSR